MNRKYLVAVALLAVLAVVFGLAGTVAPRSELVSPQTSSSSSSDSVTHFMNPPTYDSGWVNIKDKRGQYFNITHNLDTPEVFVDITGNTAILTEENWHQFWSMGDVNEDGYINMTDYELIGAHVGTSDPQYDIDESGMVGAGDLMICGINQGLDIWTYFARAHQRHFGLTCYTPGCSRIYGRSNEWNEAHSLIELREGGFAIAGETETIDDRDFWLVKTDPFGNIILDQTYGEPDVNEYARSVVQTDDGGCAIAGTTQAGVGGSSDFWLVKTHSVGNLIMSRKYGTLNNDYAESVVQTSDGGYAIAGYTGPYGDQDFYFVKINSLGDKDFDIPFGIAGNERAFSVVQTYDGGYAIAGYTNATFAADYDFFLIRLWPNGNTRWAKWYGTEGPEYAYSVVQTDDGGYALAGVTSTGSPNFSEFLLVKTDADGNMQWNRTYGGVDGESASSVVQTSDGGYALAGTVQSTDPYGYPIRDFWLVKTDSDGNMQWNRTYDMHTLDILHSMVQTLDGGYALVGLTGPWDAPYADSWLIKTSVESGLAWTDSADNLITLYRGETDDYWNFVRVRIWTIEEPTWMFGDINQDGIVDAEDLYILSRNYGKTFSALSVTGIIGVTGVYAYKKRKKQPA